MSAERIARLQEFANRERVAAAQCRARIDAPRHDGSFRDPEMRQIYDRTSQRLDQLAEDIEWALEQIR